MVLSDLIAAMSAATCIKTGTIYGHARQLQIHNMMPVGEGGSHAPPCETRHVVALLFSLLSGSPLHETARAVKQYCGLENDGIRAVEYIAGMLDAVSDCDLDAIDCIDDLPDMLRLAFKANVTFVAGEDRAIVVRYTCTDTPLEVAFTAGGLPYEPDAMEAITSSKSIPGVLLFRLGRALRAVA